MGFVYINRAKLDEIKDQTRVKPLIRQFKLTALGLNEPLHSLACLVKRTAQQAHREGKEGGVKWVEDLRGR